MSQVSVWDALEATYTAGSTLGEATAEDVAKTLKARFRAWSRREPRVCPKPTEYRVRVIKTSDDRSEPRWTVVLDGLSEQGERHPTIKLSNLPHFESAQLTLVVVLSRERILSYGLNLSGLVHGHLWSGDRKSDEKKPRPDGAIPTKLSPVHARRWCAHIDFTEKPEGDGLCTHARLHAHVTPDPDAQFQARVPLPWLAPADALDWLIAVACPDLEPTKPAPASK